MGSTPFLKIRPNMPLFLPAMFPSAIVVRECKTPKHHHLFHYKEKMCLGFISCLELTCCESWATYVTIQHKFSHDRITLHCQRVWSSSLCYNAMMGHWTTMLGSSSSLSFIENHFYISDIDLSIVLLKDIYNRDKLRMKVTNIQIDHVHLTHTQ